MSISIDTKKNNEESHLSDLEWIETNGLGGWASGTVSGMNTRRYHGLLVASLHPPVDRVNLVSKIAETIITSEGSFELDTNDFNGVIHPKGYQYLKSFTKDYFPVFEYEVGKVILRKTVMMVYGENTTLIDYEVIKAPKAFSLKLKPFISGKDYHWLSKANDTVSLAYHFENSLLKIKPYGHMPQIYINVPNADFHYSPDWYYNYNYKIELERGIYFREDLFTYGEFLVTLNKGDRFQILLSTDDPTAKNGLQLIENEKRRKDAIVNSVKERDYYTDILTLAADQFIVKRGKDLNTIIAGYHWFADWGRDTMISLPGLCLETGRYDDAKKIFKAFANVIDKGMIPNRFTDHDEEPEYNNVDGTLWYFVAIYEYILHTNDWDFLEDELYDKLCSIIDWHIVGTRYKIKVDTDGLLMAGEPGSQLTWMDAKIDNWVVTPRVGKPVEINALWYNLLKIMEVFSTKFNKKDDLKKFSTMAVKAYDSFQNQFLNPETNTLYDCITGNKKDPAVRPNQTFVLSLPFELVDKKTAKSILKQVEDNLLTSRGLRSLSPSDPDYRPLYLGDQLSRDGSYHQGTVWSWLIGSYLMAKMKIEGKAALPKVKKWFSEFEPHFNEAGIGQISEIFDASAPYRAKGCMAQAWGVAEVLRAYLTYKRLDKK